MTEHYNPDSELIYSYGENKPFEDGAVSENLNNEEESYLEYQEINNPIVVAEEYLSYFEDEERIAMDEVVFEQKKVEQLLESEDMLIKEDAEYAVLGSVFAAAPINEDERVDLASWKRVLGGAARGAEVATLAVAMMLPLVTQGKNKPGDKHEDKKEVVVNYEHPSTTMMVDNIFGKSLVERISGKREAHKALYAHLEEKRRSLNRELAAEAEIVPRSEEEKAMFKYIESKRDSELAKIKTLEIKLNRDAMKTSKSDELAQAAIETRRAGIEEMKAKVLHGFEAEIKKAFESRSRGQVISSIKRELSQVESDLHRLEQRELRRGRGTYHY